MDSKERKIFIEEKSIEYCSDNMRKLKKICDPLIYRKGVSQQYHDDLYSIAMQTILESATTFDEGSGCSFHTFLAGNIHRAFYDWTRDNRRWKRCNVQTDKDGKIMRDKNKDVIIIPDISLDAPMEDGMDIKEIISSDFQIDDEVADEIGFSTDEKVVKFLRTLPEKQRKILELRMENFSPNEIQKELRITAKEYNSQFKTLKTFENIRMLNKIFSRQNTYKMEENTIMTTTQTAEKSKPMNYSIASIIKKIDNRMLRFDHPLQRESEQWSPSMKGNLISDILQGNPIPELVFAEQVINGIPVVWNLDGKQRSTNVYSFKNNGFKISKNIRRWNIKYHAQIRDGEGNPVLDENGFPTSEYREFDIRNKKFSQLPEELQDKFLDYTFKCDQYLNCDSEEIAYHIIRYNEGKYMNKSQKGLIRIGEDFASIVKSITAMPFFRNMGGYKSSEFNNGSVDRVVIEAVMLSNYFEDWNKDQAKICEFIKDSASIEDFDEFEDMVTRLESVVTDEVADMFDSKDSFLWFALFSKFLKTGEEDGKFVSFMEEFNNGLKDKKIDGINYEDLCFNKETGKSRATKDKTVITNKMNYLEKLMMDFLGIENVSNDNRNRTEEETVLDFLKTNVSENVTEDDILLYQDVLKDLLENLDEAHDDSDLLEVENIKSMLAVVAFSFETDVDLDKWFPDFFNRNNTYYENQKENYLHMKKDILEFTDNVGKEVA